MSEMKLTFKNPDEIVEFVNIVSRYDFDVDIKRGRIVVDAKSLLGIMHLGLQVHSDNCEKLQSELAKYAA